LDIYKGFLGALNPFLQSKQLFEYLKSMISAKKMTRLPPLNPISSIFKLLPSFLKPNITPNENKIMRLNLRYIKTQTKWKQVILRLLKRLALSMQ